MGRPKVDSVTKVWQRTGSNRGAGGIGIGLVVARDDPDLALVLDPHLRGAQDVTCRMERNLVPLSETVSPNATPRICAPGCKPGPQDAEPRGRR